MDCRDIRRVRILHIDNRAAAKIDAQWDTVPERHGEQAGHAENQREGEEVPLLPQEIDVCIFKEFHAAYDPFKIGRWPLVIGRSECIVRLRFANDQRPLTIDDLKYLMLLHAASCSTPNQKSHATQTLP